MRVAKHVPYLMVAHAAWVVGLPSPHVTLSASRFMHAGRPLYLRSTKHHARTHAPGFRDTQVRLGDVPQGRPSRLFLPWLSRCRSCCWLLMPVGFPRAACGEDAAVARVRAHAPLLPLQPVPPVPVPANGSLCLPDPRPPGWHAVSASRLLCPLSALCAPPRTGGARVLPCCVLCDQPHLRPHKLFWSVGSRVVKRRFPCT